MTVVRLAGGVTTSDAYVSVNAAWSIAHGHLACAYPPEATLHGDPSAAPLYSLISGALAALFRIGHRVPFPSTAQLGPHCATAIAAINQWNVRTGALFPTVLLGYVGWPVLMLGVLALLRSAGRGRTGWEVATVVALACTPPVVMCLNEYFHPQDLIAVGLIAAAATAALRGRWGWVGALMGIAVTSQQFALLALVPLLVVAPKGRVLRLCVGAVGTLSLVELPLIVLSSGRALPAVVVGTGTNSTAGTLLDHLALHGHALFALSRVSPIVLAVLLSWWAERRLGARLREPELLLSLLATSLALRLVFEVNLWGYYFMAVAVLLLARSAIAGRLPWALAVGFLVVTYAAVDGGLVNRPSLFALPIWLWQIVLVPIALMLAAGPLVATRRRVTPLGRPWVTDA